MYFNNILKKWDLRSTHVHCAHRRSVGCTSRASNPAHVFKNRPSPSMENSTKISSWKLPVRNHNFSKLRFFPGKRRCGHYPHWCGYCNEVSLFLQFCFPRHFIHWRKIRISYSCEKNVRKKKVGCHHTLWMFSKNEHNTSAVSTRPTRDPFLGLVRFFSKQFWTSEQFVQFRSVKWDIWSVRKSKKLPLRTFF